MPWAWHPRSSDEPVLALVRRYGSRLMPQGFFADGAARDGYVAALEALDRDPGDKPRAWRYGMDETVLDERVRSTEIANWITHQVLPGRAQKGRS